MKYQDDSQPKRQYYYRVNSCQADTAKSIDCTCWHDEGTGPLKDNPEVIRSWRTATAPLDETSKEKNT